MKATFTRECGKYNACHIKFYNTVIQDNLPVYTSRYFLYHLMKINKK